MKFAIWSHLNLHEMGCESSGVGGSLRPLHNLEGWSSQNLTFPYSGGRKMVQKKVKIPLRN